MKTPLQKALSGTGKSLRVVCIGAHPDDPECGCGGTLKLLQIADHKLTIIYLTKGEAGIKNSSYEETANLRTQEAKAADKVLHADTIFAGQTDGHTIVSQEWINKISRLISRLHPDIVFTHWPVDIHPDHQVAALLTTQAWLKLHKSFSLYFYEVCGLSRKQTTAFQPTEFVDITSSVALKQKALLCHTSQKPGDIYREEHQDIEVVRGKTIGVDAAEAFILA